VQKNLVIYRRSLSALEAATEKLLGTIHYNKKPKQIKSLYRPDFKLNEHTFVNVDGLFWHSEQQKDKWYHYNLRKEFEDNNLGIFQFREDEIRDKPQIVKSIIANAIGKTYNKIHARKCVVKKVVQQKAAKFLSDNHLLGSISAKHLGLYYEEQLISLLSFKQKKHVCRIERFCSILDTNVIGGFSKLLNFLEQNCLNPRITEIQTWVDLRHGTGKHLSTKGFVRVKDTLGWKWTDNKNTFIRTQYWAHANEKKLSQQQHVNELGWSKIYDAGQRLWIKKMFTN
jgi:hypothetical protein